MDGFVGYGCWGCGGARHTWRVEDKRGRLVAFGLTREEAKRRVRGTSNRARQW